MAQISTNPAGLSEHLVRPNQAPKEPVDLDAAISKQVAALSGALDLFDKTKGKPNTELIAAAEEVEKLQLKLNEATHKLESIKAQGTPLDRLQRATVVAENSLTRLIDTYGHVVTTELMIERFGHKVDFAGLPSATKQELRLHKRLHVLRQFQPLRTSGEASADTEQRLQQRADVAGERLTALREHIAKDQKENAEKK